jgi:catechol 2,3-dioxygenase-like lactoylglutathione lyase family enzyme
LHFGFAEFSMIVKPLVNGKNMPLEYYCDQIKPFDSAGFNVTSHASHSQSGSSASQSLAAHSEPPVRVRHIDHVTLVVRDVEASRRFYVGLLGMTEVPRPAFSFDGAWFRAGATLIHLIQEHDLSGPAGYPVEVPVRSSRNHHFAFEVDDARASAERLKAMGITLLDDAKLRPDGAIQVFLTDPDYHVVELCSTPA